MFIKIYKWSLLWTLCILALTLSPGNTVPDVSLEGLDKAVHFFMFGLLMFMLLHELTRSQQVAQPSLKNALYLFILSAGLGVLIEILQLYVPGRSFSGADILADTLGVVSGYFVFRFFTRNNRPSG